MRFIVLIIVFFMSMNAFADKRVNKVNHHDNVKSALNQFAWEKRQLIVFTPTKTHPEYIKFNTLINKHTLGMKDRKLQSWHVVAKHPVTLESQLITDFSNQNIRNAFGVKENDFKVILIGYDQGEKLRLNQMDIALLFSNIDQMPMRMQEMLNN